MINLLSSFTHAPWKGKKEKKREEGEHKIVQEEENKKVVFDSQKILAASDHGIFPPSLKSTLPSSLFYLPMQETQVQSLDGEDPLEEEMATQSSMLVWKSRQEAGWLQSIGLRTLLSD